MKQSGKSIQNANLQLFLDSATNALDQGQQQFYTPANVAASLMRPLPGMRKELVFDPHFGCGSLALGSQAKRAIGLDIDDRVRDLASPEDAEWSLHHADFTLWYPVAHEVGFTAPFLVMNPPFSLQWHADRLAPLRNCGIHEVERAFACYPDHIDSTLASFLCALHILSATGDGLMVCNASTARRFFGDPSSADAPAIHPELRKFIWLWLEIPEAIYENQHTRFDTAVLYFSRSHAHHSDGRRPPLFVTAASGDPAAIDSALMVPDVFTAHQGSRLRYEHEVRADHVRSNFSAICREYAVRHEGRRPDWNIQLGADGRLSTYLTPFQRVSQKLDPALVGRLNAINGQSPISLCVTATSRTALREAAECGVWTIHPDVHRAIDSALMEFESEGAPFYRPSESQALGWIDEHSTLRCKAAGIGDCQPGRTYTISTSIETTEWKGTKINLAGDKEKIRYNGRELLVTITDGSEVKHHFHVRRDDAKGGEDDADPDKELTERHYWFETLIHNFEIPTPRDITSLRPDDFAANLARMDIMQQEINARLAGAAA